MAGRHRGVLFLWASLVLAMIGAPARLAHAQAAVFHAAPNYRSSQHFALEVRAGLYSPRIDAEFAGTGKGPHEKYFGTGKRLMMQVEFDYQFFRAFGSAAVGLSAGTFSETANAFKELPTGKVTDERSSDETKLSLTPLAALFIYRFDVLARRLGVPLVPYGKVGLNYTLWTISDSNDGIAKSDFPAGKGRGGTLGWQVAVGMSIMLDFLDPGSARELDSETGINHTYLFAEYGSFSRSGIGKKSLNVGDDTWLAGLMFEF